MKKLELLNIFRFNAYQNLLIKNKKETTMPLDFHNIKEQMTKLTINIGPELNERQAEELLASALKNKDELQYLQLHLGGQGPSFLPSIIELIEKNPGLTFLDLGECYLGDEGIKQILSYLKSLGLKLGIITNFRTDKLTYKRLINLPSK